MTSTALGVPIYNLSLLGGSLVTSLILFQNWTLNQIGVLTLLNRSLAESEGKDHVQMEPKERAKAIIYHVGTAGNWAIAHHAISGIINLTTAYIHPDPSVRRLTLYAGISTLLVFPITAFFGQLGPFFDIVKKYNTKGYEGEKLGGVEDKRLQSFSKEYEKRHMLRWTTFISAWILDIAALLIVLRPAH